MSLLSRKILFALSFLLVLPAIAVVYAPPGIRFSQPTISPSSPGPFDQVTVNVTVTAGSGIHNVTLHYTTDNWKTTNTTVVATYNPTGQFAIAHIPAQTNGGHVEYYLVAFDNNNNMAIDDNGGTYFSYTVTAANYTSLFIEIGIIVGAIGAAVVVAFYSFKPKTPHTATD